MSRLARLALPLVALVAVSGCSLSIATVSAPDINCRFDADCTIPVENDLVGDFAVPAASGEGRLQSRTHPVGEPGTPGEGLYPFVYRVDLTPVGALTAAICVRSLSVDFGPIERLDYDEDGDLDHIWVTTGGGLGTVAPSSASRSGDRVTFNFAPPGVCPGNSPGTGETSYFFGLASTRDDGPATATVGFSDGTSATVDALAPN